MCGEYSLLLTWDFLACIILLHDECVLIVLYGAFENVMEVRKFMCDIEGRGESKALELDIAFILL